MQPEHPPSLLDAFAKVMSVPPQNRDSVILEVCGSDISMRDQLARLIAAADTSAAEDDPLSDAAIDGRRQSLESAKTLNTTAVNPGTSIASYEIHSLLGEGGMGTVYLATQRKPSRQVALKVLKTKFPTDRLLRRFELETETLGKLRHPGIAQIYEAGIYERQPYFAMEYVDGLPVTEFIKRHQLGTRDKLKLIAKIASAVQHAHQHGIIHRDLKPANILVAELSVDDQSQPSGQPKVLDFGVAKLTESDVAVTTLQTDIGQLIGTISYMSPEQAAGDPTQVDTRSDVYALGVIAYEILTGSLPLDLTGRLVHEAVRIIREVEPTRLSAMDRSLRGDVETIIATSLEKEPSRRYASPSAFASDIERYLNDQPILAKPASALYQFKKYSKRHRQVVVGVAVSFVLLVAGLAGTTAFALRAESARADATLANEETTAALAAEKERTDQLESVAKFQEDQLAAIDAMTVGHHFREELLNRLAPNAEVLQRTPEELVQGIDFTGVALDVLKQDIFEESLEAIDAGFADQPLVQARLLQSFVQSAERVGLMELAIEVQRRTLAIRERELGPDHPDAISAQNNLGLLLMNTGRFDEAEDLLTTALEQSREVKGDANIETLSVLDNIGLLSLQLGRFEESEAYLQESLEGYREQLPSDAPELLAAINNIASAYQTRGDYATAEQYFREAYEGNKRVLGPDNAKTLSSANNIAVNLKNQGKYDEAEPFYIEAYEGRRRTLGDDHPRTIRALNNLGGYYRALKQFEKCEEVYRVSLEQYRRINGNNHPDTIIGISNYGVVLRDLGRVEEAEVLGREAVELGKETFPPGHWIMAAFMLQHGDTLCTLARYDEAMQEAEAAHQIMLSAFGKDHPNTQGTVALMERITREQEAPANER